MREHGRPVSSKRGRAYTQCMVRRKDKPAERRAAVCVYPPTIAATAGRAALAPHWHVGEFNLTSLTRRPDMCAFSMAGCDCRPWLWCPARHAQRSLLDPER